MGTDKICPLDEGSSEIAAEARAYQALVLCELDGDEHTTAAILECLHIASAVPSTKAPRGAGRPRSKAEQQRNTAPRPDGTSATTSPGGTRRRWVEHPRPGVGHRARPPRATELDPSDA